MNLRTWLRLCRVGWVLFALVILGMFVPDKHVLQTVAGAAMLLLISLCLWGAVLGVKYQFFHLRFGCPRCGAKGEMRWANQQSVGLDCPACGLLRVSWGLLRRTKVEAAEDYSER